MQYILYLQKQISCCKHLSIKEIIFVLYLLEVLTWAFNRDFSFSRAFVHNQLFLHKIHSLLKWHKQSKPLLLYGQPTTKKVNKKENVKGFCLCVTQPT